MTAPRRKTSKETPEEAILRATEARRLARIEAGLFGSGQRGHSPPATAHSARRASIKLAPSAERLLPSAEPPTHANETAWTTQLN
jgi:hypothetical protein